MGKEDKIEMSGHVTDVLPGSKFKVTLDDNNMEVVCTLSGKLRMNHIRIIQEDKVDISMSPYDLTKGIITWRYK